MTEITGIRLDRLDIPLETPYHLSHTTVRSFNVALVTVETSDGRTGVGEVTTLENYSQETASEAWEALVDLAPSLPGQTVSEAHELAAESLDKLIFTRTGVTCALEVLRDEPIGPLTAPVVGILSTDVPVRIARDQLREQLSEGFTTIKVKAGFDPVRDAARLRELVEVAPADVAFRVDMNQAYNRADAETFLDDAPLGRLQVIEQPLPVGNLEDHAALQARDSVTVMLDEEVRTATDLDRIADTDAAGAVKLKLMKHGGMATTRQLIELASDHGFEVVLGNGVQSDLACVLEATIWEQCGLELAGEFNGWHKQTDGILADLAFEEGSLSWSNGIPTPTTERVNRFLSATRTFRQA